MSNSGSTDLQKKFACQVFLECDDAKKLIEMIKQKYDEIKKNKKEQTETHIELLKNSLNNENIESFESFYENRSSEYNVIKENYEKELETNYPISPISGILRLNRKGKDHSIKIVEFNLGARSVMIEHDNEKKQISIDQVCVARSLKDPCMQTGGSLNLNNSVSKESEEAGYICE